MERAHVKPYQPNPHSDGYVVTALNTQSLEITNIPTTRNPFCAGHAQMADGSILVIGGDDPTSTSKDGTIISDSLAARRTLVPCAKNEVCIGGVKFVYDQDMTTRRWYPSVVSLSSGDAIIVSGSLRNLNFDDLRDTNNPTYEYFPSRGSVIHSPLLEWSFPFNLYPITYQLSTGKVMLFSANRTHLINTNDDTVDTSVKDILLKDKLPWIYPHTPTSFMLPLTKENGYTSHVIVCGGSRIKDLKADERCIEINFGEKDPQWKELVDDPMPMGRLMPDSILLPDGTVLIVNGAGYGMAGGDGGDARNAWHPIYETHLFSPKAPKGKKWQLLGSAKVPRLYHSSAILLGDGRVVTSGSEMQNFVDIHDRPSPRRECFPFNRNVACTDPFEYRMEVFSPPYLSLPVERVVIKTSPDHVTYQSKFGVGTRTDARLIDKAVFLRYSTSTHSTNFDQRYVELNIVSVNKTYCLLEAPLNGDIAPPGNYHLFLMREGKPSISATVRLGMGEILAYEETVDGEAPLQEEGVKPKNSATRAVGGIFLVVLVGMMCL